MTTGSTQAARYRAAILAAVLSAGGAGYYHGSSRDGGEMPTAAKEDREVLYYYDPMFPAQKFDAPGKSPFMDMQLVPKYADEGGADAAPGVTIDASVAQNLGIRSAVAERGTLESGLNVTGSIDFNQRDVAIVQARSGGFVQRTYGRAPSDLVRQGAPIADLLVPEWGGAQAEYLALRRSGNAGLADAARQRMRLLGMPEGTIATVARTGRRQDIVTITTPVGGVIQTLDVRPGMTLAAGQTLAQVNGLGTVWLNAAVPETQAGQINLGQSATAQLSSFPGERFTGRVIAILPTADAASRTLTVRIELANRNGRLRPGMFATVALSSTSEPTLLIPSEAVIRTGTRTIVMLASGNGRYRPAEIRIGREAGGRTEVLAGLSEGEKVIVSGQFLVDSEASLSSIAVRPIDATPAPRPVAASPKLDAIQTSGRIEAIGDRAVTLSHPAIPQIEWPAMTMQFRLANPAMLRGYKKGERIDFRFEQRSQGPTVTALRRARASQ